MLTWVVLMVLQPPGHLVPVVDAGNAHPLLYMLDHYQLSTNKWMLPHMNYGRILANGGITVSVARIALSSSPTGLSWSG